MFTLLVFVAIFLFMLCEYEKYRNCDYWKKRNVPFVKKGLFGVIWELLRGGCSLAEIYNEIYNKYPSDPHVGTFLSRKPVLLIRDLDNVQAVLTGDFLSFHNRGILTNPNDLLADNVLTMEDYQRWKLVRQKITPVFTSAKLKNMFYIMERSAKDFVAFVEDNKALQKKPFDLVYTYTSAAIGASVFGINTQTKSVMDSPFLDMAWKSVNPSLQLNMKFFIANTYPWLFKLLKCKVFGDHEDFFIGVVKKVLQERRCETEKRHDFIDLCLELQKNGTMKDPATNFQLEPTDELLAAQAFFFFLAGADTSATAIHFTLIELANNPEILKRLHKEIDELFDRSNNKLTYDLIEKLQYLDMVLNESMRKYPPIGLMNRKCTEDTILPVGGLKITKGTMVVIPVLAIHRDPKYFADPEKYDPERFNQDNAKNIVKCSYLPFSEGGRVCIGKFSYIHGMLRVCSFF